MLTAFVITGLFMAIFVDDWLVKFAAVIVIVAGASWANNYDDDVSARNECVPIGSNYDGITNAWYGVDGTVVAIATNEDERKVCDNT